MIKAQKIMTTALIMAIGAVVQVHADDEIPACESVQTDMVSLYYMTVKNKGEDVGAYYKAQIDHINKLAEKNNWTDYKMTSQDVSVSMSSYGTDANDINVSVSFQFAADYDAISVVTNESGAYSISASRYEEQICADDAY